MACGGEEWPAGGTGLLEKNGGCGQRAVVCEVVNGMERVLRGGVER